MSCLARADAALPRASSSVSTSLRIVGVNTASCWYSSTSRFGILLPQRLHLLIELQVRQLGLAQRQQFAGGRQLVLRVGDRLRQRRQLRGVLVVLELVFGMPQIALLRVLLVGRAGRPSPCPRRPRLRSSSAFCRSLASVVAGLVESRKE